MRFNLLGPLEVLRDAGPVDLGGTNQRAVLGSLLLSANKVVATGDLVRMLWGAAAPVTSRKMVQNSVSRLRRMLSGAERVEPPVGILTRPPGYQLRVPVEWIDVHAFHDLVDRGRADMAVARWDDASRRLRAALALWRGPALADLAAEGFGWPELSILEDARLGAFEDCAQAELVLGRHQELASELEAVAAREPTRERLCGLLMVALYRCSRQRDALLAYQRTRAALVERFGLDPGPQLRELEYAILNQELGEIPLDDPRGRLAPNAAPAQAASGPSPAKPSGAPQAARKWVTAVLLRAQPASGDAPDPERADEALLATSAMIAEEVGRFDGTIHGVVGSLWCIVFGVPRTGVDDPDRAVRAVLGIRNRLGETDGEAHLLTAAVATGEMMITYGPDPDGPPVAVTGCPLDWCQDILPTLPPGSVRLCDATWLGVTDETAELISAEPGAAVPVPAGQVRVQHRRASPFVGRSRELGQIGRLLGDVHRSGRSHLLTLIGETGIGKSRLVAEFEGVIRKCSSGSAWLTGRVVPVEGHLALDTTHAAQRPAGTDPLEPRLAAAVRSLARDAATAEWLLGRGDRPAAIPEPGTGARRVWCEFLEDLAGGRTSVLAVEDLHQAAEPVVNLIDHLVDRLRPVPLLIIATARPELLHTRPTWTDLRPHATTRTLGPLSDEAAATLIQALAHRTGRAADDQRAPQAPAGGTNGSDVGFPALLARVGGNPLFAEEYARQMGKPGLADLDLAVPPPPQIVRGIVAAGLDRLSWAERGVLEVAAIFGHVVWDGALAAVSGRTVDELACCLESLERKELLARARCSSIAGEVEYLVTDPLICELAYVQMPRRVRAERHVRAAAWIQDGPVSHACLIARHYGEAIGQLDALGVDTRGLTERARRALVEAGRRAENAGAPQVAVSCYESALHLCPARDPHRAELLRLYRGVLVSQTGERVPDHSSARIRAFPAEAKPGSGRGLPQRQSELSQAR